MLCKPTKLNTVWSRDAVCVPNRTVWSRNAVYVSSQNIHSISGSHSGDRAHMFVDNYMASRLLYWKQHHVHVPVWNLATLYDPEVLWCTYPDCVIQRCWQYPATDPPFSNVYISDWQWVLVPDIPRFQTATVTSTILRGQDTGGQRTQEHSETCPSTVRELTILSNITRVL